jgi:hypothetical protein
MLLNWLSLRLERFDLAFLYWPKARQAIQTRFGYRSPAGTRWPCHRSC